MIRSVINIARSVWRGHKLAGGERPVPEETAVAFTYNGGTYAVMMATPQNLEDFAYGFSLTEGIIEAPDDILDFQVIENDSGIELRMWLSEVRAAALTRRRRYLAGPTGCGLCGIESLTEALRPPVQVRCDVVFMPEDIIRAIDELPSRQALNRQTHAVHAAAFWTTDGGLIALREDVGRHNALDKLCGALLRDGISPKRGMVLLTSRVSVEMVQKTAALGAAVLVAVSAPTALAIRTAEDAGMTLLAIARSDGFEVFTDPQRIQLPVTTHVY